MLLRCGCAEFPFSFQINAMLAGQTEAQAVAIIEPGTTRGDRSWSKNGGHVGLDYYGTDDYARRVASGLPAASRALPAPA